MTAVATENPGEGRNKNALMTNDHFLTTSYPKVTSYIELGKRSPSLSQNTAIQNLEVIFTKSETIRHS